MTNSADSANFASPVKPDWRTIVFAPRRTIFPCKEDVLWTFINRNQYAMEGEQIELPVSPGTRYFDLWHGVELHPSVRANNKQKIRLAFSLERGLGTGSQTAAQCNSQSGNCRRDVGRAGSGHDLPEELGWGERRDPDFRKKLSFDLFVSHDPAAIDDLIHMAKSDQEVSAREQAIF